VVSPGSNQTQDMTTASNVTDPNQRLLRFLSATLEQQAAIDRVLLGQVSLQPPRDEPQKGPLLLRVKDAAGLLGVHRTTMWRLVKAGRLETVELLGSLRVRRADVEAIAAGKAVAK
jgi:excisionase family DNA binding protein